MRCAAKLATLMPLLIWNGHAWCEESLRFAVRLDPAASNETVSGRLFVMLTSSEHREPRFGPSWFSPEPFFRVDVESLAPGETVVVDRRADAFPAPLQELPEGVYFAQAVLARSHDSQRLGTAPGNLHGEVVRFEVKKGAAPQAIELTLDEAIDPQPPTETPWGREIRVPSQLLSDFHERTVEHRAVVVLPPSYYAKPKRRYGVVYVIPGFGGSHLSRQWEMITGPKEKGPGRAEFIRVMLTGQCEWGHHVFANSATNGPRGNALIEELIPYIDRQYRTIAKPTARFVAGHSSGGWASLWLQVAYPETFGGVWSIAPDPVDFHDFQRISLYADPPENMYVDPSGRRRPIARRNGAEVLWYDDFCRMDDCLERGGQMRSFEAVFSPLDENGLPQRLWNRATGAIDRDTAEAWRPYDIVDRIESNWDELRPVLDGKIHVTVGDQDTFYLEGAVVRLKETLDRLGANASIEILADHDHGSVLMPTFAEQRAKEMTRVLREHHGRLRKPLATK